MTYIFILLLCSISSTTKLEDDIFYFASLRLCISFHYQSHPSIIYKASKYSFRNLLSIDGNVMKYSHGRNIQSWGVLFFFFSSFCCIPIISKILRYALWLWFSHYNLIGPGCWRCRNVWNSEKCCGHSCRFVVQLMHFVLSPFQFIRMTKKWHTNGAGFVDGLGMGNNTKVSFKWFHQFKKKKKKKFNWFYIQRVPFFLPLFCFYFGSPHMCRLQSCELVWKRW